MSRARPLHLPSGDTVWVDTNRNGEKFHEAVSDETLELLMTVEEVELDDLLDGTISQGDAVTRIRTALGQDVIPEVVIRRRDRQREARQVQPKCRICGIKGNSTKHHFVNKWMLRELDQYAQKWADRTKNCIPLCISCHREAHARNSGPHSIVEYLTDEERGFTEKALSALSEQHPKIVILAARGDDSVYETRLVRDWIEGHFSSQ